MFIRADTYALYNSLCCNLYSVNTCFLKQKISIEKEKKCPHYYWLEQFNPNPFSLILAEDF